MPRNLSALATSSVQSIETGEVFLLLLEIKHSTLTTPYRLVNNTEKIVHQGNDYIAYPFNIELAADDGDKLPEVRLTIDNVDRSLVQAIRSLSTPPEITLKLVIASQPDTVELTITDLILRAVTYDAYKITGTLYAEDILNSRFPAENIRLASGYLGIFS